MKIFSICIIMIVILVFLFIKKLTAPEFDEFGNINMCIGCPGCQEKVGEDEFVYREDMSCKYNPRYWENYEYIGPSDKELKNLS